MPLTNKEKMARRRAKLNADPQKKKADLEKDRLRKAASRRSQLENATEEEIKELKKKESERVKSIYHRNKRQKQAGLEQEPCTPTKISPFSTKQSLGKAVKRVSRCLPDSPRKRLHVVKCLAKRHGISFGNPASHQRGYSGGLSKDNEDIITNFFNSDEISWQAPGRKDRFIYREKDDKGKTIKRMVQSRYLITSLAEAYHSFKEKYPEIKVGLSKFCSLRPKHCMTFANIPHNVCVCSYHENVHLLVSALKQHCDLPLQFKLLVDKMVCNSESKTCMSQACASCKDRIVAYTPEDPDEPLRYFQWQKVENRVQKMEILSTVGEAFDALRTQMKPFLIHTYIKRVQAGVFNEIKSKVDGKEILLQLDFSENASLIHQNEIQSAHWSHSQATLFTAYAWIDKDVGESCVVVSNDLEHTKIQIYSFTTYLLRYLKEKYPEIRQVNIFSDGTSAQFKNRFMFSIMHLFEDKTNVKIAWNFFATSHGKGVVDGIGGTVKRSVWNYVKANPGHVTNTAEQFARTAAEKNQNVMIAYITKEEVDSKFPDVEYYWDASKAVPNTHSIHFAVPTENKNYILVGETSKANEQKVKVRVLEKTVIDSESDEEMEDSPSTGSLSVSPVNVSDLIPKQDWVVVQYDNTLYPGEIQVVTPPNEVTVKVMHLAKSGAYYYWPKEEDCITYCSEDIVKKIEPPIPYGGTREHYKFLSAILNPQ